MREGPSNTPPRNEDEINEEDAVEVIELDDDGEGDF